MVATEERVLGFETFAQPVPELDEILTLKSDYEEYFASFHERCDLVDDYLAERNSVPSPEGFQPIHSAKARATINNAAAHVDVNNVDIDVPLTSQRAKARAERLQKFYQGTWLNVDSSIKRRAVRHAFSYGVGWFKQTWATDLWPDAPHLADFATDEEFKDALDDFQAERDINFPIRVDVVHPRQMIWDVSRLGHRWAMEFYETRGNDRTIQDLQMKFPEWSGYTQSSGLVSWIEYWDDRYCVFIINNEIAWRGEHNYGFMPYIEVFPDQGNHGDNGSPEDRYIGILDGGYELLDEIDRSLTAHSAILRAYAWQTLDFAGPDHLVEPARENYEIFGGKNSIPTGVSVSASPKISPPQELLNHLATIETEYESLTFPDVVRGIRPTGVSSGFQTSVLAGMGRLVFQPVADAMANAIMRCNSNFAKLVENKALGKITVHARSDIHAIDQTIGPDDIRGYYENKVTLKAEAPEERERESMLAIRLLQSGIISLYEAQKRAGVVNPLEMQVDIISEQLERSPESMALLQQLVSQRVGLFNQFAQTLDAQAQAPTSPNTGNQFLPNQSQLQRPGEANIQRQRVFARGIGEQDVLGSILGGAAGGEIALPSGGMAG
jgi:hypothetical protein